MLRGEQSVGEDEIKSYVKENLANYKVPREVVFVDELPRNATGKVLKRELLEQVEDTENGQSDNGQSDGGQPADEREEAPAS